MVSNSYLNYINLYRDIAIAVATTKLVMLTAVMVADVTLGTFTAFNNLVVDLCLD